MVVVIMGGFYRRGVPTGDNEKLWIWLVAIIDIWYHSYRCLNLITVANSMSSFTTVENGVGGGRERERGLKGKGSECL